MGERASGLRWVVDLAAIGAADVDLVGGKGARLGELVGVPGVHVPPGFCVTTEAFRRSVARRSVARRSAAPGRRPGGTAIPEDIAAAVTGALAAHGAEYAYAVRSSATAEDLPIASFAGAHESFLNLVGAAAVLAGVRRCWASLGTERAIAYRARNGIDDGTVQMAVVVQRMVDPRASGVLFTADPVTGNRRVSAIETVPGLGDALVTGRVNAAAYRVREAVVLDRPAGVDPVLTDEQAIDLAALGRRIEAHAGCPQDIEWCLTGDGDVHIVQARPITTLFPIPAAPDDAPRAYVSVGHQQMMTDPMRPLGLSIWRRTALAPMHEAGGRLFVEVTDRLAAPQTRAGLLAMIADGDPCTGQALQSLLDRGFLPPPPPPPLVREPRAGSSTGPDVPLETIATDPAIVAELVAGQEASLAALRREIAGLHGPALFAFIDADIAELKGFIGDPVSHRVIMAGFEATAWLNDHLEAWLGERNAADVLTRSVPGNVTAQMGLALLEVADAIRPHPEVIDALERAGDDLDALLALPGGRAARAAITGFLDRYGMRCIGEIDITRPRWREAPSGLMPMLLGNVRNAEPGAGPRRFAQGEREAQALARDVLERLRALPDGAAKAEQTRAMIERVRAFNGYREYPKFVIVNRYLVYRQALLGEGERLGEAGVLRAAEDAFFLTFDELRAAAAGGPVEQTTIRAREAAFRSFGALTPPRVLTSEGEALTGQYRRADLPVGALPGLAVSTGTVEGRARVVADPALDLTEVALEPGDILVARYTDPSATPLFLTAAGLVTEVGGRMTHGAVIAREYGLPAVVGVEHATGLICDGRRIRVHGTDGYVELLPG